MGLGNAEVVYPRNSALPKLNQMQWMQYVLDNSATVDEAVRCAEAIEIDGWGWHFFVGDGDGRCASIDFDDGRVVVHQGAAMPVPGLFNALYAREVELARYFRGFGGAYEPRLDDPRVPRYVKTAIMLKEYDASRDAVAYGFQVLKNLTVTETPDWSVLFDVRRRVVHFKTSLNPQVKRFAIADLDFANTSPVLILDIDIREGGDVGARFAPFSCEAMAGFIAALPLPAPFWEMGGLRKQELVERLATHTAFAQQAANQPFAGCWRAKPGKPGEKPAWEVRLFCKGDAVLGEISGPEKLAERTALEHIRLAGGKLVFTFKSRGAGNLMEARADIGPAMMTMELWGLEDPVGRFELFRQPPDRP